jgi:hypothetical protein
MHSSAIALACSVVTFSIFTTTVVSTAAAAQQQKPDVVFILADNVGYGDPIMNFSAQ